MAMRGTRGRSVLVVVLVVAGALVIALMGYAVGSQRSDSGLVGLSGGSVRPGEGAVRDETPSGSATAEMGAPAQTPPVSEPQASSDGAQSTASSHESLIIRSAAMEVRVEDVDETLGELREAVARSGGEITDMSKTAGDPGSVPLETGVASEPIGPATAYVTIRVPADRLSALETEIATLGTVVTQTSSASDVTEQAIDLEARLRNLRAEEVRLRSLYDRTDDVEDLLAVERELARVRGEIESMDAQLTYLKRQAARATLTVTLAEPGPVVQPAGPTWGLREAVTRGIQATARLTAIVITLAIPMAAFGGVVLIMWLPIRSLRRRRLTRRTATEADESQPQDVS